MNIGGSFLRLDTDVSGNSSGFLSNSPLVGMQERYYVGPSACSEAPCSVRLVPRPGSELLLQACVRARVTQGVL